jgi:hypothetical protein
VERQTPGAKNGRHEQGGQWAEFPVASELQAFGKVGLPWLLMTGIHDSSLVGDDDVNSRLAVFPALAVGDKYELVLNQAGHSVFTERALPGDAKPRNPNHHRVILGLSTAFWDLYLLEEAAAKVWLRGGGAKSVLQKGDSWRMK